MEAVTPAFSAKSAAGWLAISQEWIPLGAAVLKRAHGRVRIERLQPGERGIQWQQHSEALRRHGLGDWTDRRVPCLNRLAGRNNLIRGGECRRWSRAGQWRHGGRGKVRVLRPGQSSERT